MSSLHEAPGTPGGMLPDENLSLDQAMKCTAVIAAGIAAEKEHVPMLFVETSGIGQPGLACVPFVMPEDPAEKAMKIAELELLLALAAAPFYLMVVEGWEAAAERGPDDCNSEAFMRRIREAGGVSQLPPDDRQEVLILMGGERGRGVTRYLSAKINQGPRGRELGHWEDRATPGTKISGAMVLDW